MKIVKKFTIDIIALTCALFGWIVFFFALCMAISKHMAG